MLGTLDTYATTTVFHFIGSHHHEFPFYINGPQTTTRPGRVQSAEHTMHEMKDHLSGIQLWEERSGGVAKKKGRDDEEEPYRATQGFIQINQRERLGTAPRRMRPMEEGES